MSEQSEQLEEQHREFKSDEDFDPDFFRDIERKSKIFSCIQCGTCTASCESGKWTALKTRNIIRKVCLGDLTVLIRPRYLVMYHMFCVLGTMSSKYPTNGRYHGITQLCNQTGKHITESSSGRRISR